MIDPRTVPMRFSNLKKFSLSAAHYRAALETNDEATWLRKGSATHALVYGTPRVVVFESDDPEKKCVRNGKRWEAFKAEHEGAIIVNRKEFDAAEAMASAVRTNPVVMQLGLLTSPGSIVEQQIDWEYGGRAARSTPDLFTRHFGVDLKSTKFAKPDFFLRELVRQHYHVQGAFYRLAIAHRHGFTPREFYIIAVESKFPHPVVVYRVTPRLMAMGERMIVLWTEELRVCESSNEWPGYVSHVVEADVPEWLEQDDEDDEDEEDGDDLIVGGERVSL